MSPEEIQLAINKLDTFWRTSQFFEGKEFGSKLLDILEIQQDKESLARVYLDLGIICTNLSEYSTALMHFLNALTISEEIGIVKFKATILGNIGSVYLNLTDYQKALEYYSIAININEILDNKRGIALNYGNIGTIYWTLSEYTTSLEYFSKSLQINEEIGNKNGIADNLVNIGLVYQHLSENTKALEYFFKGLLINEEVGNKYGIATNLLNIGSSYWILSDFQLALEYFSKSLLINEEIGNKNGIAGSLVNIGSVYATKNGKLYDIDKAQEFLQKTLSIAEEIGEKNIVKVVYDQLHSLRFNEQQFEEALHFYKKSIEIEKEIQSKDAKNKAQLFDQRRKLEEDEKARQLKLARFQEQEKILHNILPVNIADRIIKQENFIADHFHSVSVLFMDLVGFTSLASIAPPKQLVYLLDAIFQKADEVVETFGLEKIKTIGDGYLAVANVTSPLEEHQKATALAALQLIETLRNFSVNIPSDLGDTEWIKNMNDLEIRIGIHTGEVVAGIIGKNKYTYDLWGDAVNVASRMESNSEAGRIQISEEFAKSIELNSEFCIIPRGEIKIKGKGTMKTYWLEKGI